MGFLHVEGNIKNTQDGNKYTNKQMGPNETEKLLHSKGNHKQDQKTTLRMGEILWWQADFSVELRPRD